MSMNRSYDEDSRAKAGEQEYDCYVVAVVRLEVAAKSGVAAKDIAVAKVRRHLEAIDPQPFIPKATVVERGLTGEELAEMVKRMKQGLTE